MPAPVGSGVYQVMLTVTDDSGRVDSALVVIASHAASSSRAARRRRQCLRDGGELQPAPPAGIRAAAPPAAGGGGGGALDLLTLGVVTAARRAPGAAALRQPFGRLQPLALRAPVMTGRDARLLQQLARDLLCLFALPCACSSCA